jgi:hypothetical protein
MLGRVDNLQFLSDPQGFGRIEGLIESSQRVRVEIVADQSDPLRLGIPPIIDQLPHLLCPIDSRSAMGSARTPPTDYHLG